jgi:asparagine synthetase A
MALMNGKTVEEITSEIMDSTEDHAIMISGLANEDLEFLVKSKNSVTIAARGQKWFEHERESLTKALVSEVIHSLAKAKRNYLADKEVKAQNDLFQLLVTRGISVEEAVKSAYPNGVPKPRG